MPHCRIAPKPAPPNVSPNAPKPHSAIASIAMNAPPMAGDRIARSAGAETNWQRTVGGRQVTPTKAEGEAARLAVAQAGRSDGTAAAQHAAIDIAQNRYDASFEKAARLGPFAAKVLKSQDYQESNLTPSEPGGGIAQMDASVAAKYGVRNIHDPAQAIAAQAAYERDTAKALGRTYANFGGDPKSPELQKFVLGAYNAGKTTVTDAMQIAHDRVLAHARRSGLPERDARSAASHAATTWHALFDASSGTAQSPFYQAAHKDLRVDPGEKYDITKSYVDQILARSNQ